MLQCHMKRDGERRVAAAATKLVDENTQKEAESLKVSQTVSLDKSECRGSAGSVNLDLRRRKKPRDSN